jgi:hypothetical protein
MKLPAFRQLVWEKRICKTAFTAINITAFATGLVLAPDIPWLKPIAWVLIWIGIIYCPGLRQFMNNLIARLKTIKRWESRCRMWDNRKSYIARCKRPILRENR